MAAKSSFPSGIGLWIFSALIIVFVVTAKLAADRFFDTSDKDSFGDPAITIRVDHPNVMDGDGRAFLAFVKRAAQDAPGKRVAIQFAGKMTALTVPFVFEPRDSVVWVDVMWIVVEPDDFLVNDEVVTPEVLMEKLSDYARGAALCGSMPYVVLRAGEGVSLGRLHEFFELGSEILENGYYLKDATDSIE